ncbi:MAG: hypothetical protein HC809_02385 [Gammaproteobacteria bacterium]|nr:hypothetical protein [Gammaproteobacteria bacterium]
MNQYEETQPAVDYSHHQYSAGTDVSYRLFDAARIGVYGNYAIRRYEVLPARELDGTRFTLNPALEYQYMGVGMVLRQRMTDSLWAVLDYSISDREDEYVGYDDYRRHSARARLEFNSRKIGARLAVAHRDYEFANAFAFDTPAGGDKALTSTSAELDVDYRVWRALSITAFARLRLTESSDPRYEYDQSQVAIGMKWAM